jgi:CRP-like cAMP-binding protein
MIGQDITAARQFLQWMAEAMTRKQEQMLRLAYCSLRRKVADALLYLLSREKKNEKGPQWIEIGRECLASIAGTATESLIRTLSDFRNEGIIEICEGVIRIRDMERLKGMPN